VSLSCAERSDGLRSRSIRCKRAQANSRKSRTGNPLWPGNGCGLPIQRRKIYYRGSFLSL